MLLAQNLVEYSALTALTRAVERVGTLVEDSLGGIDRRILIAVGVVAVVWIGRRLFR